ncbi:MAG TPA: hypothetical protein VI911_10740 [Patescibacteria group bacterium]|nr:hypothetical protein [Patescibacteria group bacterium]
MILKCPFCSRELKPRGETSHLRRCKEKTSTNVTELKYLCIKHNYPTLCNKEKLEDLYINNKKSLPDLKKEYDINYSFTLFLLKYFNIKKRTIKESTNLKETRDKYKNTCIKKYGVKNTFQLPTTKNTLHKKYGNDIDNIFQVKEIIEKIKTSLDSNLLTKYGVTRTEYFSKVMKDKWKNITDEEKNEWLNKSLLNDKCIEANCKSGGIYNSSLEYSIREILLKLNIPFSINFVIKISNKKRRIYDILIDNKIIIEVNGDYWHANPNIYKADDLIKFNYGIESAREIWDYDKEKKKLAESKGFKVVYIWEDEIKNCFKDKKKLEQLILKKMEN